MGIFKKITNSTAVQSLRESVTNLGKDAIVNTKVASILIGASNKLLPTITALLRMLSVGTLEMTLKMFSIVFMIFMYLIKLTDNLIQKPRELLDTIKALGQDLNLTPETLTDLQTIIGEENVESIAAKVDEELAKVEKLYPDLGASQIQAKVDEELAKVQKIYPGLRASQIQASFDEDFEMPIPSDDILSSQGSKAPSIVGNTRSEILSSQNSEIPRNVANTFLQSREISRNPSNTNVVNFSHSSTSSLSEIDTFLSEVSLTDVNGKKWSLQLNNAMFSGEIRESLTQIFLPNQAYENTSVQPGGNRMKHRKHKEGKLARKQKEEIQSFLGKYDKRQLYMYAKKKGYNTRSTQTKHELIETIIMSFK